MTALRATALRATALRTPTPLLVAIGVAWALAIAGHETGVAHALHHDTLIEGGGLGPAGVALFLAAWVAMVVAMMLPSSLPLVQLFAAASSRQPRRSAVLASFLAGYVVVWTAFGAAAFAFDGAVHATVDALPWLARHDWLIGANLLVLAGAFQFTSLKYACLDRCRAPGAFLLRHYRRGAGNAMAIGARHGVHCVGCCWALMLVMFAAGVASIIWMALLTTIMVHEKTHPTGRQAVPVTGAAALGLASILLVWGASA
jgi:predicted metal-binding membrane protein